MSGTKKVTDHPGIYVYEVKKGPKNKRRRYAAVVTVQGKQKWLRGYTTIGAAEEAADIVRVDMRGGQTGKAPARLTYREYVESRWWPYAQTKLHSSESVRSYIVQIRHVKERLGDVRLASMTPLDVEGFKSQMLREGVGPSMANAAYDRLRQSLRQAMRWELITRNPCALIEAPHEPKHRAPILQLETIKKLLAEADTTVYGALIYLAAMTGLRWGELTSLRWSDVDVAEATLRVPAAKTEAGIRPVKLGPKTIERLHIHRLEQIKYFTELGGPPPQLVFTTTTGTKLMQANFLKRYWGPMRAAVGLSEMHFHDLRHVHSTLMARAGVHPSVMQSRLGHADSKTTLDIYTHVDASQQIEAAAAVESLLDLAQT